GLKVQEFRLEDVKLAWQLDEDRLTVKDVRARLYGGTVTGNAVVPLHDKAAGNVDLSLKGIDIGRLVKDLQPEPLPIEGKADGVVKGKIPPAPPGKERPVTLALDLKAPELKVQGIAADAVQGTLRFEGEDLVYQLQAKTLGGRLEVE